MDQNLITKDKISVGSALCSIFKDPRLLSWVFCSYDAMYLMAFLRFFIKTKQ